MAATATVSTGPQGRNQVTKKDLMKDLRNTHFDLGHDGRGDFKSIYHRDYPEWPLTGSAQTISNTGLRKTHFIAGVEDMNRRFNSMYKEDYIEHPPSMSVLNAENKKDLRTHHFNLGFDKRTQADDTSEHHHEYVKKYLPPVDKEMQSKMRQMVSGSSKIWDDPDRYMKTIYDEDYVKKDMPERATKADIQNKLVQLRSSNILMGSNGQDYNSIFMQDYVDRPIEAFKKAGPSYDLKATHYKIGIDQPVYESSHKVDYYWKDPEIDTGKNIELAKDLRAHHYNLGNYKPDYQAEYKANYTEKPVEVTQANGPNPYKLNYKIGDGSVGQPNHYTSVYREEMVEMPMQPKEATRDNKNDNQTTLVLGDPNKRKIGITEFTDQYVPKKTAPSDVQKQVELKKQLLSSKIDLGRDGQDWGTTYRTEHTDKGYCKDFGRSEEIKKDLRSTHYKLGYGDRYMGTTHLDEFIDRGGQPSFLDPMLAKDLRSHHGHWGMDPLDWNTTYRTAHYWKQPDNEEL